jgi:hypothetical protein
VRETDTSTEDWRLPAILASFEYFPSESLKTAIIERAIAVLVNVNATNPAIFKATLTVVLDAIT